MNGESAFGVQHGGEISKAEAEKRKKSNAGATGAAVGGTAAVGTGAALAGTKIPEHSHYDRKTRKYLHSLKPGVHEVDTKMLAKRPRKLGARKQQTPYVAAMAQERPEASFKSSPVPVTRYKGRGHQVIQRDNAHTVMANAMKGKKTLIQIEDAPGYRPNRRTGEELVRRGQMKFQQHRLKRNFNLGEKKIESLRASYTEKSRKANTAKRPHGVVEEGFKMSKKPYGPSQAVPQAAKAAKLLKLAKRDDRRGRDVGAGVAGASGVGVLATTPVRRSAAKVKVHEGKISAESAKKIASPGYRPGNKRAIKVMSANLGHLEKEPTTIIRYKDGRAIPFDGNHRMTARVARGDKKVPVRVVEGGERPAISVTRNAYHVAQQRLHRGRMERGVFKPDTKVGSKSYTGKHSGETKAYRSIANASPTRSGKRVSIGSMRSASGPTKAVLRARQGGTVAVGAGLLGTAGYLARKKD